MNTPSLKTIVGAVLGAAVLCGCSSTSQNATPSATAKALKRDPVIETYVGAMRADLSDGKIKIINSVMQLNNDEAKVFWPIYEEYESELFDLGDLRVALIRRFATIQQSGRLKQEDASKLADDYFKFEQQQLDLKKKYHDIIAKELTPIRAAQFSQIEHRVGTIVDLAIASELPLIQIVPNSMTP